MTPERRQRLITVLKKRQTDLTVVLENVFDLHNISAVLRTCDAVGIQEVYVLNTKLPPHQRWGYRSSSGAYKWIRVHQFTDLPTCMAAIRKHFDILLASCLNEAAVGLYEIDFTKKTALFFGNEHTGLSDEIQKECDGHFIIPQDGMILSLNISVACAVTVYEAYRQKKMAGHYQHTKIPAADFEKLLKEWGGKDE